MHHERFIVVSCSREAFGGHWGQGETLDEAVENCRKAGGRKRDDYRKVWRFTSELPFAPVDRDALSSESDAYVGQDGQMYWKRCERVDWTERAGFAK